MELPAIVAVTVHVPVPAVTETDPPGLTVHAVDAPASHVTVPPVVPPEADSVRAAPYAPLEDPETVSEDWAPFAAEMLTVADVES